MYSIAVATVGLAQSAIHCQNLQPHLLSVVEGLAYCPYSIEGYIESMCGGGIVARFHHALIIHVTVIPGGLIQKSDIRIINS